MPRKNDWPRITIITPSLNQGQYLEQTIRSVVGQNYPNLEYLVLDGGSTDNSVAIIKRYTKQYPQTIKWRSRPDGGQVAVLNEGLSRASGDIVAYLNSDDFYLPGAFQQVAEAFRAHPEQWWVTGRCQVVDGRGKKVLGLMREYVSFWRRRYSYCTLLVLNCIAQPATFWRREAITRVDGFDPRYKYAFDYKYWLKLGKLGDPIILRDELAAFRAHRLSKSTNFFPRQFVEELRAAKKYTSNRLLRLMHWSHVYWVVLPGYRLYKWLNWR